MRLVVIDRQTLAQLFFDIMTDGPDGFYLHTGSVGEVGFYRVHQTDPGGLYHSGRLTAKVVPSTNTSADFGALTDQQIRAHITQGHKTGWPQWRAGDILPELEAITV